jgi:hypothetical protein
MSYVVATVIFVLGYAVLVAYLVPTVVYPWSVEDIHSLRRPIDPVVGRAVLAYLVFLALPSYLTVRRWWLTFRERGLLLPREFLSRRPRGYAVGSLTAGIGHCLALLSVALIPLGAGLVGAIILLSVPSSMLFYAMSIVAVEWSLIRWQRVGA